MGKPTNQRRAKARFELIKGTVINDTSDDFFDIKWLAFVCWNHAVQFFGVITWWLGCDLIGNIFRWAIQMTDDITSD